MYLSRKVELKPNNKQTARFRQHAGVARHAWNWALAEYHKVFDARKQEKEELGEARTKIPTAIDLHKRLVAEVKKKNPWYYESSKCAPQEAIRNLEKAFKRVFKVKGTGWPKFKKRGDGSSFYLETSSPIKAESGKVKLPSIGWVRTKESIPEGAKFKSVVVSERAGRWFLAYRYEVAPVADNGHRGVIGVDLGVSTFAFLSDGSQCEMRRIERLEKKLIRLQRSFSRKVRGSNRQKRVKTEIARCHYRISNVRKDVTNKLTSDLAKNHGVIVIEDLCVGGMVKNHHLAAAILRSNFGAVRHQLSYKCELYGSKLVVADRWFPSSKTCSSCGCKKDKLRLSERTFSCDSCGLSLDRDLNAARNLEAYGRKFCGDSVKETVSSCSKEQVAVSPCEESMFATCSKL